MIPTYALFFFSGWLIGAAVAIVVMAFLLAAHDLPEAVQTARAQQQAN
jgi:hypothetical protein